MHRCKDTHNRKVIGNIISVLVLTTDDQVLEKAVSCKSLCGSCITDFVEVIQFDPDTVKKFLCGFSMETENVLENSRKKLKKKNLDMIAANSLKVEGAGFGGDTNVITIITEDEEVSLELMSKEEAASKILDQILARRTKKED